MGVEYKRYLIPRPNTFRPAPDVAWALISALRNDGWLLAPDSPSLANLQFASKKGYELAKQTGHYIHSGPFSYSANDDLENLLKSSANQDLNVVWPIESLTKSGLKYPLIPQPFKTPQEADDCYYELEMHFGKDFIYQYSEVIHPFDPAPTCKCGNQLEYFPEDDDDPFYCSRLSRMCAKCGNPFDPTELEAEGRDGWTGKPFSIKGGAAYRFALVVDCGKFFGKDHVIDPQLKRLVEEVLHVHTYEVPDFY